jgi:Kef-type K+ transport system membrane component KefB
MQKTDRSKFKRIGVDIAGYLCIVASALTGWLPGPGGIPLLIIGLSLLATNHEWAERLLNYVKRRSSHLADVIFDGKPAVKLFIDVIGIVLIALAVYLLTQVTKSIAQTASISLVAVSLVLLLGNRNRFKRLKAKIRKNKA